MSNALTVVSGYKPPQDQVRKREPLLEQQRKLTEPEVRYSFQSLSRRHGETMFQRFQAAKDRLERDYDAFIGLVEPLGGGVAVSARLEFLTTHRTLDENLDQMVRAAGFSLTLRSRPMMELPPDERFEPIPGRFIVEHVELPPDKAGVSGVWLKRTPVYEQKTERLYVITESPYRSADPIRAAESAESLLALVSKLRPANMPEDLPQKGAEVIPITSARASRAPPPEPASPPLVSTRAS